jgi:hypothetical protein
MVSFNPLDKINRVFIMAAVIFSILFAATLASTIYFYYKYDQLRSLNELTKAIENQPTRVVEG